MAKEKKIKGYIKLQIPAGAANPAPPVGPALGQHGSAGGDCRVSRSHPYLRCMCGGQEKAPGGIYLWDAILVFLY